MTISTPREHWLEAAQGVLRRLSSPADDQLQYLRNLGIEGSIDELGLEFDDVWRVLSPLLEISDRELQDRLSDIARALSSDNVPWDAGALRHSLEWHRIRELARLALEAMRDDA